MTGAISNTPRNYPMRIKNFGRRFGSVFEAEMGKQQQPHVLVSRKEIVRTTGIKLGKRVPRKYRVDIPESAQLERAANWVADQVLLIYCIRRTSTKRGQPPLRMDEYTWYAGVVLWDIL